MNYKAIVDEIDQLLGLTDAQTRAIDNMLRAHFPDQSEVKDACKTCDFYEGCEHEFTHTEAAAAREDDDIETIRESLRELIDVADEEIHFAAAERGSTALDALARLTSARADCISERERGDLAIRQRDEARLASDRAQIVEECRAATLGMTKPECLVEKDAALDKVKGLASARAQGEEEREQAADDKRLKEIWHKAAESHYARAELAERKGEKMRACLEWISTPILLHERHGEDTTKEHSGEPGLSRKEPREGADSGDEKSRESSDYSRSLQRKSPSSIEELRSEWPNSEADRLRRMWMGWGSSGASQGLQQAAGSGVVVLYLSRQEAQAIHRLAALATPAEGTKRKCENCRYFDGEHCNHKCENREAWEPAEVTTLKGEPADIPPCPKCGKPAHGSLQMIYGCGDGNCNESITGWAKPEWIEHCQAFATTTEGTTKHDCRLCEDWDATLGTCARSNVQSVHGHHNYECGPDHTYFKPAEGTTREREPYTYKEQCAKCKHRADNCKDDPASDCQGFVHENN